MERALAELDFTNHKAVDRYLISRPNFLRLLPKGFLLAAEVTVINPAPIDYIDLDGRSRAVLKRYWPRGLADIGTDQFMFGTPAEPSSTTNDNTVPRLYMVDIEPRLH